MYCCYTATEFVIIDSTRIASSWRIGLTTAAFAIFRSIGPAAALRDGAHDFDFLIGDWKAHVRRLPDRLVGSTTWIEYDGISNHKKILDTNANFEEFEVDNPGKHLHIKGQTLRLYNPESRQWSIYTLDLDKGALNLPPVVGQFTGNRGEFYDQNNIRAARSWCATSG